MKNNSQKHLKKYLNLKLAPVLISKKKIYDNFCVLLTASIDPNGCFFLKRTDPKIREKDYLESLELWLSKTSFKIVFCENSGYDLGNITELCDRYPGRVEIIQFNGNDYPRHLGKGYGEALIIQKAMAESEFIKNSESIIKVTGRVFIKNIDKIVKKFRKKYLVQYSKYDLGACNRVQTVVYIFKPEFFKFQHKYFPYINDVEGEKYMDFEMAFERAVCDAKASGHICKVVSKPDVIGICGTLNVDYNILSLKISKKNISLNINKQIGILGRKIKSKSPKFYEILKPYFPDKK